MYLFLSILFSFSLFATSKPEELAQSQKWRRLLHYKKSWMGSYVSEADGKRFFLHPDGKNSPELELKKNIELFSDNTLINDDHAICRFPLRFKWLNQKLGYPWKVDLTKCTNYVNFFSKLAARRASVIFSSYYLGNPNSAFGHTLLRLSRYENRHETEMLDYGINYSAVANESNPFLYAVKGLFGGFEGKFAAVPYYYKIREYTNVEFRDLWSYDLKLSLPQILEMVDHIWELGDTYFDYFYFHENCSYHLLSIIEVAVPEVNLTDKYHVYTIPADTVRLLKQVGLIEEGTRRESTYSKLTRLSSKLSAKSLRVAKDIALKPNNTATQLQALDKNKAADILDVSIEAFDYYNFDQILKDDLDTKKKKNIILEARAKNPVITMDEIDPNLTKKDSPAFSHAPTRLSLTEGYADGEGKYSNFEFRAALHDVFDPPAGSLKTAQIEMGKLSFKFQEQKYTDSNFIFDQLTVFNLKNYPEQNFWASPMSWEADVGGKQLYRQECYDCPAAYFSASVGNSLQIAQERILLAILLNGEINIQSQFDHNYRLGVGPKIFTRYKMSDSWIAGLTTWYHFNTYELQNLVQDYEWQNEMELRFHMNEKISLLLKGRAVERERNWMSSAELGLQYFYE